MDDESESEYTDSFITSDDYEDELMWNSDDSRPPAPSPPSSANMNDSPAANIRNRLRRRTRRRANVDSDSQTDEDTVLEVTVSESNPPSPTVSTFMIHDGDSHVDTDSDSTNFSPSSPLESPPESLLVMTSPEPDSDLNIRSPSYSPSEYSPDTPPPYSPSESSPDNTSPEPENDPGMSPRHDPPLHLPEPQNDPEIAPVVAIPAHAEETAAIPQEVLEPSTVNDQPAEEHGQPVQENEQPAEEHGQTVQENEQPANNAEPPALQVTEQTDAPNVNNSLLSDSEDNSLCTICMDPLTNSGQHRVVCLRCGHIFGLSCVERWIKIGCNNGAKRCPTCNKRAGLKDIRVLYLPKVVPLDTVERDRLIQEKEVLTAQKNILQLELTKYKLQTELSSRKCQEKIRKLEKELFDTKYNLRRIMLEKNVPDVDEVTFKKQAMNVKNLHSIVINKEGGCRVLAYSPILHELVVSQPSGNTMFAGFGVRVLNSVDFQPTRFMFLHNKMIRDLAFHPDDRDLLLSVSLDQSAKLVDMASSTTVHTFKGEGPLWSCCWDTANPHLMLVGSQVGKVCQYDRRMTKSYVNKWSTENNMTPVVSLASVPSVPQTLFPQGGFLSCRLNKVFAYSRLGDMYNCQELQLTGPFMAMRYDRVSQNILTSSRPCSSCPYVKISLNLLDVDLTGNACVPLIHSFNCGSSARVLSRMTTVPVVNDSIIVAHNESGRTLNLWSSKTGNLIQSMPITEPVIDVSNMCDNNNKCLFASLSEKQVCIYKIT